MWEAAEELSVDHSIVIWHVKQIRCKSFDKWVPRELTANQKNCFEVWSSLILFNNKQTISLLDCDVQQKVDFIWQPVMTPQWLNLEKPFPNLHQKKVMVTVCWSAAHLIHYNFLNPGETITSDKYAQQIN